MNLYFILWISLYADGFTAFIRTAEEQTAIEGKSARVSCVYDMKYRFYKKYWCQGSSRTTCDILGDTEKFVKRNYKNRLELTDRRRGVLWVTMHQLAEDDSGTYWCGIDKPYADLMVSVKLKVNKAPTTHHYLQNSSPSTPSSTVEVTATFTDDSKFNLKTSLPPNSTCYHTVTEKNWNYTPWAILRCVFLVILMASFILIHWNII